MKEHEVSGMRLAFKDTYQLKGIVDYTVYKNGKAIEHVHDHNLIVTVGRTQMAHLLAGDFTIRNVAKIAFGTSGTTPALTDTAIANAYTKNTGAATYPAAGQVQFPWTLTTAEDNGQAILEFGLICANGTLFSRRIRESGKPINKEADISLEGTWTIIF
jgi:hypothetical protein